jgi:DNA-binding transcriptional LysR family regulator
MQWSDRIGRRLKPRDLHIFLAVAEHANMAKAAEYLAISRPVVSKTIAELERLLRVPLFDRTANGVEPTEYGRSLLKRSTAVFDELRHSVEEIEFLADPGSGEVRCACTEVYTAGVVSTAIDRMSRQFPNWTFQIELGNAASRLELLRSRTSDMVVARDMTTSPDIRVEPLFYERLLVVVGEHNRWARRRKIALTDLAGEQWIQARREVEPGGPTFRAFAALGLSIPKIKVFSDSLNLRYNLLATGRFVTMIPASALLLNSPRAGLKVLPVAIPRWDHPTAILTLKNRAIGPVAQRFMQCVRDVAAPLAKDG